MSAAALTQHLTTLTRMGLGVPLLVVALLAMVVVPLPPLLLDAFFTFNITLSLVIMLAVIYVTRPLEFAVFPTVLLGITLLRLALNVASTRVVLLHGHTGPAAAGRVIEAFGNFVVGGNYAVGIVDAAVLAVAGLAASDPVGIANGADIGIDGFLNFQNLLAGTGNDTITANDADNYIYGDAGNDTVIAGGAGVNGSGTGNDYFDGGTGNNTLDYHEATNTLTVDMRTADRSSGANIVDAAVLAVAGLAASAPVGLAYGADIGIDGFLNFQNLLAGTGNDTHHRQRRRQLHLRRRRQRHGDRRRRRGERLRHRQRLLRRRHRQQHPRLPRGDQHADRRHAHGRPLHRRAYRRRDGAGGGGSCRQRSGRHRLWRRHRRRRLPQLPEPAGGHRQRHDHGQRRRQLHLRRRRQRHGDRRRRRGERLRHRQRLLRRRHRQQHPRLPRGDQHADRRHAHGRPLLRRQYRRRDGAGGGGSCRQRSGRPRLWRRHRRRRLPQLPEPAGGHRQRHASRPTTPTTTSTATPATTR